MHDDTHPLFSTQRMVRAIREVAGQVARSMIAEAFPLATVTAIGPLTITVDSATIAVAAYHLNWYTPVANDRVLCLSFARQILVLGTFT